jgi:LEA14-like dessication related protein
MKSTCFPQLLRRFGLIACALIISGCASLSSLQKPSLEVVEVRIASFDRDAAQLTLTLRVTNPNAQDISLTDVSATLFLLEQEIAQASTTQNKILLPASSTVMLPLRLDVPFKTLPTVLERGVLAFVQGGVPYRIKGSATTNNGLLTVPFERSGNILGRR